MHHTHDSASLHRWRTARRVILGAIVLAGSMATTAAAVQRMTIARTHAMLTERPTEEVYSGIGVTIRQQHGKVFVTEINPTGPSVGKLHRHAMLLGIDGERLDGALEWKSRLRGEAGTTLTLDVLYSDCRGHQTVELTRAVVHARP